MKIYTSNRGSHNNLKRNWSCSKVFHAERKIIVLKYILYIKKILKHFSFKPQQCLMKNSRIFVEDDFVHPSLQTVLEEVSVETKKLKTYEYLFAK